MYEEITKKAKNAVIEILDQAKLKEGSVFVVGCSSSTVKGENVTPSRLCAMTKGVRPALIHRRVGSMRPL